VTLTAEQTEIRDLAREFASTQIRPDAAEWDESRTLGSDVFGQLGELGFMGMLVPEAYGGLDLDVVSYLLAVEGLAWGDAAVALAVAIQNGPVAEVILAHGGESQKEAWLPRLASGECLAAFALSEPSAGSDAAALSTVARRQNDFWVLNGQKKWVTNGARADVALVFAREDGGDEVGAIAAFLVETDAPGYTVGRREKTMGLRASETLEIALEDIEVGDDRRIPLPGGGFVSVLQALDLARLSDAALSVGIAQAAFEHATRYALEREQFGHPIADFGAIQAKLAEMATRIAASRALTLQAGQSFEAARRGEAAPAHGTDSLRATAAMAKLTANHAAMWVADEAVQVYGGYGYMRHYPVEKLLRDAKGTEILEGTSEIMRVAIAREVIKAAKEA
jgi:alkylation response protein AidB-like acyl-CoA dehydrogenase